MMNTLKRVWLFLLVMFVVPLIIIGIGYFTQQSDSFTYSILASIATSLIAAGIVYWFIDNRLRALIETNDEITVVLESPNGGKIECPPMSRKDFNRSEVLGYIGMLGGPDRYEISSIKSTKFGMDILDVKKSKGNKKLIVKCTDDEIKKFIGEEQQ